MMELDDDDDVRGIQVTYWPNGSLQVAVSEGTDVSSQAERQAVAFALRAAADSVEYGHIRGGHVFS